ncbi:MAG: exodeoxyribonuclease subunit beta [Cyanobacteria bacterium RYN_339]|nr:exodeoxyribonuclease subunit beta [Cyanobacteria bacterium RYN_339]
MMTDEPQLVSASAGTGKTYWIVQQITGLLVDDAVPLDRIGVITFTEAAAAELRARVAGALKHLQHEAADQVAGSPITTINGFALGLIKRYGLALGQPADVVTLDEGAASRLRAQALNGALEDAVGIANLKEGRTPDEVQGLISSLVDKARCLRADADELRQHGETNAAMLREAFGEPGDGTALDTALAAAFAEADLRLPKTDLKKTDEPIIKGFKQALRELERGNRRKAATLAAKPTKPTVAVKPIMAALCAEAQTWLRHHPDHLAHLLAASDAAYAVAAEALQRYGAAKQAAGCVDFSDQIGKALDLLESDIGGERLASLVAKEMPYLFVDEFQDTSPLQFRLAETLREHGCRVSYVGDLKQAIYGWRDADSRLMGALLDTATRDVHSLADNWRSRPELVAFNNQVFGRVFSARGLPFSPVRSASKHNNAALPTGPSVELLFRDNPSHYPKAEAIIPRLQALVASGREILDKETGRLRPLRWSDVAVLGRGNAALDEWAAGLSAAGLPFTRELDGWCGRPEVRGAVAWLRCLANPYDSWALATALCSGYFGLGADQLAPLAAAGGIRDPLSWLSGELAPLTDPRSRQVLARFRTAWQAASRLVRRTPLSAGVRAALDACEAFLVLAAGTDAEQARANVLKLVELASRLEAMDARSLAALGLSGATPENFLGWLAGFKDTDDDKQPLVSRHGNGAIQLLTMHRAKGLEFPVVVVPSLRFDVAASPSRCEVDWPAQASAFLGPGLFGQSRLRYVPDHPDVGDLRARLGQQAADDAAAVDAACLLYVAFTRARDHLMVGWTPKARVGSAQELLDVSLNGETLCGHPVLVTQCMAAEDEALPAADRELPNWVERQEVAPVELWQAPPSVPPSTGSRQPVQATATPLNGRIDRGDLPARELGQAIHEALCVANLAGDGLPDDVLASRLTMRWSADIARCAIQAVVITRALLLDLGCLELRREVPFMTSGVALRVDALMRHAGGYMVLDFKLEDAPAAEIAEHHAVQLAGYRDAVSALLGVLPEAAVVALGSGQLVRLAFA